VLSFNLFFINL